MQSMQNQKKHKFTTPKLLSSFQNNIPSILASSNNPSRAPCLRANRANKNFFSATLLPFNSTCLQNSGSWVAKTPKTVWQASGEMGWFFPSDSRHSNASTTIYATPTQRNGTVKHRKKDSGFQEDTTTEKEKKKTQTIQNQRNKCEKSLPSTLLPDVSMKSKETLVKQN